MTQFPVDRVVVQNFEWLEYFTADAEEVAQFVRNQMDANISDWIGIGRPRAVQDENEKIVYVVDVNHFYKTTPDAARLLDRLVRQFGDNDLIALTDLD